MATPLEERRISLDGEAYTFVEFVRWYGQHPETLMQRWASAPPAEPVGFDERAVASQLVHAFRSAALERALQKCWCPGEGQAERVALEVLQLDRSGAQKLRKWLRDGKAVPESVLAKALRLDLGLASALQGCLLRGEADPSLARALWSHGDVGLSETVALEVLRLAPECASTFRAWSHAGEGMSERVALEALRLDPGCANVVDAKGRTPLTHVLTGKCSPGLVRAVFDAHPSVVVHHKAALQCTIREAAMPLVVDALRLVRLRTLSPWASGQLLWRLGRERSGVWQVMEAGATIPYSALETIDNALQAQAQKARWDADADDVDWAGAAWCHGVVVRCDFLARGLRQRFPPRAAFKVAAFLCGDNACKCRTCRANRRSVACHFLARSFSCRLPLLAAFEVARLIRGDCGQECSICRRTRQQVGAVPDARADATVGAEVAGGRGAAHAGEDAPLGQAQEAAPVEEEVEHSEPAAVIHPEEAVAISAQQWTTAVDPLEGAVPPTTLFANAGESGGSGMMLLEFGRRPKEMYDAILDSDLAVWLIAEGVDVRPDWAGGRLVLVPDATEGDFDEVKVRWHVAVLKSHEEAVYVALRSLGHRVRPRLKANGRTYVPENNWTKAPEKSQTGKSANVEAGDEEFDRGEPGEHGEQEDEGGHNEGMDSDGCVDSEFEREDEGERSSQEGEDDEEEAVDYNEAHGPITQLPFDPLPIPVYRTFVHFRAQASSASAHAQSAPSRF